MPKLSDAQAVLLAAAARPDLSVLPAPETLKLKGAALERSLKALLGSGFIAEEVEAGERRRVIATPAGLDAIGVEPSRSRTCHDDPVAEPRADTKPQKGRPGGKLGVLLDAVSRADGATLEELTLASGWLPHTTRAAITRLRQRGYDVRIASMGARKAYPLVPAV
jgi:DNA-binding MarR family transcriptional regulator